MVKKFLSCTVCKLQVGNMLQRDWELTPGSFQPAQKGLKDRRGPTLSMEEIQHYQKIIVALVFLTGPSITKKRCKKIFRSTTIETQL